MFDAEASRPAGDIRITFSTRSAWPTQTADATNAPSDMAMKLADAMPKWSITPNTCST